MYFYPTPLRGGDRDASPGAGKEAERRYMPALWMDDRNALPY